MTSNLAYILRPLTQADEPFLWEMLYQALYVPPGGQPFPREAIHSPDLCVYVENWGRNPDDFGYLAALEGSDKPIGAAWQRRLTGVHKGYGYVDDRTPEISLAVLPEFRNRGIGTCLLNRLIEAAEGRYPALSLSVVAESPAVRLYLRVRFVVVGRMGGSLTMVKLV